MGRYLSKIKNMQKVIKCKTHWINWQEIQIVEFERVIKREDAKNMIIFKFKYMLISNIIE